LRKVGNSSQNLFKIRESVVVDRNYLVVCPYFITMYAVLVISSIACGHALFWAVVLFRLNNRLSNRLLSLLLFMLALRVGKSVTGFVFPGHMDFFSTLGLLSMAQIGPLAYFFTRSLFDNSFRLRRVDYLHFLPGIIAAVFALMGQWRFYYVFTAHVIIYVIASAYYLFKNKDVFRADDLKWQWITFILGGITILWITFVLQLIFYNPLTYRLIVISAAAIFYSLSLWAIPRSKLFVVDPRKKHDDTSLQYEELGKRISELFERSEIFRDPNLTVTKLASQLKVPSYLVSRAINSYFEKSFSELLVQYRIQKSETLLIAEGSKVLTIEAIAYESGFNTLSAFYSAFKKINKITPAQFRDRGVDRYPLTVNR
jgi:AraC-like DNA-binding protein